MLYYIVDECRAPSIAETVYVIPFRAVFRDGACAAASENPIGSDYLLLGYGDHLQVSLGRQPNP